MSMLYRQEGCSLPGTQDLPSRGDGWRTTRAAPLQPQRRDKRMRAAPSTGASAIDSGD